MRWAFGPRKLNANGMIHRGGDPNANGVGSMLNVFDANDVVSMLSVFNANGVTPYQPGATPQVSDPTSNQG